MGGGVGSLAGGEGGVGPILVGDLGYGVEGGGSGAGLEGGDLPQEGVGEGMWGPWGDRCGSGLSHSVTGRVGRPGRGGCLCGWQIRWPPSRRAH